MSLETRFVRKIEEKVGKELEKSFNREEDLDSYIKRTMHGKLAKKITAKKLKSEGKENSEVTNEKLVKLTEEDDNKSLMPYILVEAFIGILLVIGIILDGGISSVGIGTVVAGLVLTVVMTVFFVQMVSNKSGAYIDDSVKSEESEERDIIVYNEVYEYDNKNYRYYEVKGYKYVDKYLDEGKLRYKGIVDEEVSKPLSEEEIEKFKELYETKEG